MPVVLGKPAIPSSSSSALSSRAARAHVREVRAGLRVEVEAQLVGVVGVVGAVGPDVEAEAGEVDGPGDVGDVGGHERPRGRAVDGLDRGRLQPLGHLVRHALLEERRAARALREALHQHRPAAHGPHQRLAHGGVVAHEVELRLAALGEQHLARAGDPHLAPGELEHLSRRRPCHPPYGMSTDRQVTHPSMRSNSPMSTTTTSKPQSSKSSRRARGRGRHQDAAVAEQHDVGAALLGQRCARAAAGEVSRTSAARMIVPSGSAVTADFRCRTPPRGTGTTVRSGE